MFDTAFLDTQTLFKLASDKCNSDLEKLHKRVCNLVKQLQKNVSVTGRFTFFTNTTKENNGLARKLQVALIFVACQLCLSGAENGEPLVQSWLQSVPIISLCTMATKSCSLTEHEQPNERGRASIVEALIQSVKIIEAKSKLS
jgi:hypothetical protein